MCKIAKIKSYQLSHIHCCHPQKAVGAKGFGLFTSQDLKKGQFVIEYLGEVSNILSHALLASLYEVLPYNPPGIISMHSSTYGLEVQATQICRVQQLAVNLHHKIDDTQNSSRANDKDSVVICILHQQCVQQS